MIKCKKCFLLKIDDKSKCACNIKPFNEKKLFKERIAQVSEKKKERIKEEWSEIDFFKKLFKKLQKENKNKCIICKKILTEENVNPSCFAHILPKWRFPEFRYFENNIWLVCWIEHHNKLDELVWEIKIKIWSFDFEQLIRDWKNINI